MKLEEKIIGVLMGGLSSERDVSITSGNAVLEALQRKGLKAIGIDVSNDIAFSLVKNKIDIAFIAFTDISEKMGVSRKFWNPKIFHIPAPVFPQVDLQWTK